MGFFLFKSEILAERLVEVVLKLVRCQEVVDYIGLCNLSVNLFSIKSNRTRCIGFTSLIH